MRDGRRNRIVTYLLEAYSRVGTRTCEAGTKISERDMTVAARKIAGFFRPEPGKIPYEFGLLSARDIASIELTEAPSPTGGGGWSVALRIVGREDSLQPFTRYVPHPLVALAWCSLNRLFRPAQPLRIRGRTALSAAEARSLTADLCEFFPSGRDDALDVDELAADSHLTHLFLIPNIDVPEWSTGVRTLFVLKRNSMGELHYTLCPQQTDCLEWLGKQFPVGKPSRRRPPLWRVYQPRGRLTAARLVERHVREMLGRGSRP